MIGLVIEISKHAPENVGTYYDIRGTAAHEVDNSPARSPVSATTTKPSTPDSDSSYTNKFCSLHILLLVCLYSAE